MHLYSCNNNNNNNNRTKYVLLPSPSNSVQLPSASHVQQPFVHDNNNSNEQRVSSTFIVPSSSSLSSVNNMTTWSNGVQSQQGSVEYVGVLCLDGNVRLSDGLSSRVQTGLLSLLPPMPQLNFAIPLAETNPHSAARNLPTYISSLASTYCVQPSFLRQAQETLSAIQLAQASFEAHQPQIRSETVVNTAPVACNSAPNVPATSRLPPLPNMNVANIVPKKSVTSTLQGKSDGYTCEKCGKRFKHRTNLNIHFKLHSSDAFICSFCDKRFARKSNLKQHLRVHTNERPFACTECPKKFKQRHSLCDHLRIHTGEKPFRCEFCSKGFAARCNYIVHVRMHTGERPYRCDQCNKQYASKSGYNSHRKKYHQNS